MKDIDELFQNINMDELSAILEIALNFHPDDNAEFPQLSRSEYAQRAAEVKKIRDQLELAAKRLRSCIRLLPLSMISSQSSKTRVSKKSVSILHYAMHKGTGMLQTTSIKRHS